MPGEGRDDADARGQDLRLAVAVNRDAAAGPVSDNIVCTVLRATVIEAADGDDVWIVGGGMVYGIGLRAVVAGGYDNDDAMEPCLLDSGVQRFLLIAVGDG